MKPVHEIDLTGMMAQALAGPALFVALRNAQHKGITTVIIVNGERVAMMVPPPGEVTLQSEGGQRA